MLLICKGMLYKENVLFLCDPASMNYIYVGTKQLIVGSSFGYK